MSMLKTKATPTSLRMPPPPSCLQKNSNVNSFPYQHANRRHVHLHTSTENIREEVEPQKEFAVCHVELVQFFPKVRPKCLASLLRLV